MNSGNAFERMLKEIKECDKTDKKKNIDVFEEKDFISLYPFIHHKNRGGFGILVVDKTHGVCPLVLYPRPLKDAYEKQKQATPSTKWHKNRQIAFEHSLKHIDRHIDELLDAFKKEKDWGKLHKQIEKIITDKV